MDSYIIRIYRRDKHNHPIAGTIERVGKDLAQDQRNRFNDKEILWELLSLPEIFKDLKHHKKCKDRPNHSKKETENQSNE